MKESNEKWATVSGGEYVVCTHIFPSLLLTGVFFSARMKLTLKIHDPMKMRYLNQN